MRLRRIAVVVGCGLLATGCGDKVDFFSSVHDLRVLAIQADPPDVLIDPATAAAPNYTLRALVADREGSSAEASYAFVTCEVPDGSACKHGTPEMPLSSGSVAAGLATGTFAPSADLIARSAQADPYKGFGGVPLLVLLRVANGSERVEAYKRVVLSRPEPFAPDVRANANPPAPRITVDGVPAAAGAAPLQIPAGSAMFETVAPAPGEVETYWAPTFDHSETQLTEAWEYSWFTTRGHFSPEHTGGTVASIGQPTSARLVIDSEDGQGPFRVWVVVRDGRGGVAWTQVDCAH